MSKWFKHALTGFVLAALSFTVLAAKDIKMATTTSTENSGLLKAILPQFEAKYGAKVQVISVGSGKAMKLGEAGDVDVLLVHARPDEDKFMAAGHGVDRRDVMYNDFILVGPKDDPAKVRGMTDVIAALKKIQAEAAPFISRGDDSGTDKMEKSYWKTVGIEPKGAWYVSAGQGMGEVLTMSASKQGYTLSDRATYGAYRGKTDLDILVEGDPKMFNPYGVIVVSNLKYPDINIQGARAFADWITSAEGQKAIADFKVDGQQLFFPSAKK